MGYHAEQVVISFKISIFALLNTTVPFAELVDAAL